MKSEKINILHVSIADGAGGAAIAANRLHELMNKTAMLDSKMLVLIKKTLNKSVNVVTPLQRNIARVGIYLDKLFTIGKKKGFGLFSVAPFGVSISQNPLIINADVIYLHWVNNGFLSISQINLIFSLKKPVFLFCHDMWYFTGGCHQSYGCAKFEIGCENCHFFKSNFIIDRAKICFQAKQKIYDKNANNLNFIGPSTLWQKLASSSKLVPKNRSYFISNIVDEQKFRPLELKKANEGLRKYKILYGAMGGKTNEYKGWDYFAHAISLLPKHVIKKIDIVLFGYDFTQEEIAELDFTATSVGAINSEDRMVELYQSADIYIFPSLQESFGQTLMEAMACGLPAVAFPVGAAEDLIKHKENGYLAKYKDAKDIAAGIEYLVDDDRYDFYAKNARQKIVNEFNAHSIIDQHITMIRKNLQN